jgi:hypothetical protein
MNNSVDLIFEEWKASLKVRDRSSKSVESNFEDLFTELKNSGASFEEAYAILPKAVKAHAPSLGLAKNTYKNLKHSPKISQYSEKEFIDKWNDDIKDKCTAAFFSIYPRPKNKDLDDDGEPKVYGNMSAKEYRLQRKYAEQFPILNTAELERRLRDNSYNPVEDLKHVLGGDKNGDFE